MKLTGNSRGRGGGGYKPNNSLLWRYGFVLEPHNIYVFLLKYQTFKDDY